MVGPVSANPQIPAANTFKPGATIPDRLLDTENNTPQKNVEKLRDDLVDRAREEQTERYSRTNENKMSASAPTARGSSLDISV